MHFGLASYSLALLAGLLSTLSPCVLPIVPILLGSAMNAHRRAPIALAAGLAISYATIGTALAWAGTALELDSELVRRMGAALLGLFALVGAAIVLASQGKHLAGSAALMGLFSVGAALPIVILGHISRSAMMSVRRRLLQAGRAGKVALGSAMLLIASATISGRDRQAEAWLVNHSPAWLTNLTTRF